MRRKVAIGGASAIVTIATALLVGMSTGVINIGDSNEPSEDQPADDESPDEESPDEESPDEDSVNEDGILSVAFIDVGQGDAILIETPDDKHVLIDSGPSSAASTVVNHIDSQAVTVIDVFILTHPDADHIGGASSVLAAFDVSSIYHPGFHKDTVTYSNILDAVATEECPTFTDEQVNPGDYISISASVTFMILSIDANAPDSNSASIVIKMSYGSIDFLFTGDVDTTDESDLVYDTSFDLDIEILKVTHHGSEYGTSDLFLTAATPEIGIICVGDNSYGHPAPETLERLDSHDVAVYRTDLDGTVIVTTDGSSWQVS